MRPQPVNDARVSAARDHAREPGELLEVARRTVVPADDQAGVQAPTHGLRDRGARRAHRHRGRLDDGGVRVAVHHQAGQGVAFGVRDAVRVSVQLQGQPALQRGRQPLLDQRHQVRRLRLARAGHHPQRQPRPRRPGRDAERPPPPVADADQRRPAVAGVLLGAANDVRAEHPGVAARDAGRAARADDGRFGIAHRPVL